MAINSPVDGAYHLAATSTSTTIAISGANQQTHRYHVVNGGAQEVFLVLSRSSGITAAFPAAGAKAKGYVIAANSEAYVDGPICGEGNTVYAAAIAPTGTTDLYITPVARSNE